MKEQLNHIKSDRIVLLSFIISAVLLVVHLIIILINFSYLPPFLPMFNQLPWSQARLGVKEQIFIPLIISFLFYIINSVFAFVLYRKMPLVSRILCVTTLFISFCVLLFTTRTIQIVL